MDLNGKVVIVTGAARGLGREIAIGLDKKGCSVIALDIDKSAIEAFSAEIPHIKTYACDVTDPQDVAACIEKVYTEVGEIDCLINNAGRIFSAPLINPVSSDGRRHSFNDWINTINSNLNSVFCMTLEVADRMMMARKKGVIVNISSVSAKGNQGQCAYSAAKAGVEAFTKSVGKELGAWGIRVVAVAPGFMDTPSTREAMNAKVIDEWKRRTSLRRLGSAENVVSAVVHVMENDFITAGVVSVDGGVWL